MREDDELFIAITCDIGDAEPVSDSAIGHYGLLPERRVAVRCFRESGYARYGIQRVLSARLRKDEKLPEGCRRRHACEFLRAADYELWDAIPR